MPIIAGVILAPILWYTVGPDELPLWAYAVVVVFCDVGHVWGTLFRCYMDTAENRRRALIYNLSPVLIFAVTFGIHFWLSEAVFWMIVGYTAIFHFIRQQWGFLCLYRARALEVEGRVADQITHAVGALGPIAVWHADENRSFDWFMREDPFLIRLPPWSKNVAIGIYVTIFVSYCVRQMRVKQVNVGKVATMLFCWVTWAVGVLCPHKLIAVFFLNMFHAAPSYMIVFFTARNKFRVTPPPTDAERLIVYLTQPGSWWKYLAFFVTIAVFEEVCYKDNIIYT